MGEPERQSVPPLERTPTEAEQEALARLGEGVVDCLTAFGELREVRIGYLLDFLLAAGAPSAAAGCLWTRQALARQERGMVPPQAIHEGVEAYGRSVERYVADVEAQRFGADMTRQHQETIARRMDRQPK